MKKERKESSFIKKPVYLGGSKAMKEFIAKELVYPKEALENKIEGTVRMRYDIDYKGIVFNVYILSSVGYGCDEEAERIVRKLKFQTERTRKIKVAFHKDIQIHFKLPQEKPAKLVPPLTPKITTISYQYSTTQNQNTKLPAVPKQNQTVYTYTIRTK